MSATVGARGSTRADVEKTRFEYIRAPVPSTTTTNCCCSTYSKNILGYSTRNDKFKRLEPHFQISATRSGWKEVTKTAVALPHSRECTKEPTSASPNDGLREKFGATKRRMTEYLSDRRN